MWPLTMWAAGITCPRRRSYTRPGERPASAARAATPGLDTTLAARRLNALIRRFLVAADTASLRSGLRFRPMRWDAVKHALDTDVLVEVRPMDTLAGADETKVCSLLGSRLRQTPRPGQRNTDDSAASA